ncbi:MAG TPA: DNA polymerase III subunit beta [Sphingobacteriaceae bacterium]
MKFSTSKSNLLAALSITGKCVSSRSIIPILDNYLFNIDGDTLEITGSSQDVSLTTIIDISGDGSKKLIAIPASRLIGLIQSLPEVEVCFEVIEIEGNKDTLITVEISAGKGKYTIASERGVDFPILKNTEQVTFEIASAEMLSGINKTLFACTVNGVESYGGLSLSFEENRVTYSGVNGHLISTFTYPVLVDSHKSFIVPVKPLAILKSVPLDEKVKISIDDKSIVFRLNANTVLKSVLSNSRYPDYKAVIPTSNSKELVVNRPELVASLRRVTQFANRVTDGIKIQIDSSGFTLIGEDTDFAQEAREALDHTYSGDPITILFNGNYLINCLSRLESDTVHLYMTEHNKPLIIREQPPAGSETSNLVLVAPQHQLNG